MEEEAVSARRKEEEKKPVPDQFQSALSVSKLINTAMSNINLKQNSIVSAKNDAVLLVETEEDEKESRQPLQPLYRVSESDSPALQKVADIGKEKQKLALQMM